MSRDVREKSDHRGLERVRVTSGVGWGEVMWGGSQHRPSLVFGGTRKERASRGGGHRFND